MKDHESHNGSVKVEGMTLQYTVEGFGIPALVIGSAIFYLRTFSHQLRKSLRLAFTDLRHFAKSDDSIRLDNITLDTYAKDIDQIRSALGFKKMVVIGHSHHGNLALEYAKKYPENVTHVVLIGSPPCDVKHTLEMSKKYWLTYASEDRKAILRKNRDGFKDNQLVSMMPNEAYITQYVLDGPMYWYNPNYDSSGLWEGVPINMDVVKVFRDFFTDYKLFWDPVQLEAPVLVMMGRHDYIVPHTLWDKVIPKLENITYCLFDRSGHTPQVEEQKLFDQTILKWLENNPPTVTV